MLTKAELEFLKLLKSKLQANRNDASFQTQWSQEDLEFLCQKIQWMLRFKRKYRKFTKAEHALSREVAKTFRMTFLQRSKNPIRNARTARSRAWSEGRIRVKKKVRFRPTPTECVPKLVRLSAENRCDTKSILKINRRQSNNL